MSEENKKVSEAETDKPHHEVEPAGHHGESAPDAETGKASRSSDKINPIVFLLFMILAMVVALAVISLSKGGGKQDSTGAEEISIAALKADLAARLTELNRQRAAMGLQPLEGTSEPIEDIAARVKSDADTLVGMAGRFQQMLAEKDSEISQRNGEVLRLEKLRQDVSIENSRLQTELNRAFLASTEVDQLNLLIADTKAQRDALSMELKDTRAKLAEASGISADDFADLQRRYDEAIRAKAFFENRCNELEAQLNNVKLFATSENELLPAAVELFRRLRTLEGVIDSDLTTEYSKLGVDLGANVLHTLNFKTGSSELSPEDLAQLTHIAEDDVPDGDLTLIIGYASKTGDTVKNERLSSDRATAAAQFFTSRKRPGQKVQAVYLGQTDRFSSGEPELNQICEVWRIRRK